MNNKPLIIFLSLISLSVHVPDQCDKIPDYLGEVMHYNVSYGLLNIGRATISFTDDSLGRGYHIKAEAKSVGVARFFYSLNYLFECFMDTLTGLPVNATESLADRRSHYYDETVFDHHSREDSSIIHSQMSGMHVVPKDIHDLLTAYYCFRKNYIPPGVKTGQEVVTKIYITEKLWDLKIRYVGRETIETKFGKIECLKYIPSTVVGKFFKNEDDMTIWITNDAHYIPVRLRLNLILGSIIGDLVMYQKPIEDS